MRVSIIAPAESDRTDRQHRFFATSGHDCRVHVQKQPPAQDSGEIALDSAAPLKQPDARNAALFLFHYIDEPYPLLETMRQLGHGLVVLDLGSAALLDKAPVCYADLCLVADAAHKLALNQATGYAPERIYVLPENENYGPALETIIDQAMQGKPSPPNEIDSTGPGVMMPAEEELETTLLIRDPALDREAILDRIRQAIRLRLNTGGYGPDVTSLGPEAFRPVSLENEETDQSEALLRLQVAFDALMLQSQLREPSFRSQVPLLGPLIVAVRRFWNWMSAKWYVRGWMAQQVDWNNRMVDLVTELLTLQERNERRIRELELRVKQATRQRENTP